VAVDGAVVDIDLIVIGHVHQLIAAFHEAGPLRQRLQQQELGHGQRHVLPFQVTAWRSGSIVSSPRTITLAFLGRRRRRREAGDRLLPAQQRADALDQQTLRERLLDVVVGAHAQAQHLVDLVVLGGQEDHRHRGFLAQPLQQVHAVHARHLDVEDGHVRQAFLLKASSAAWPSL
jgi:hypothetical protein